MGQSDLYWIVRAMTSDTAQATMSALQNGTVSPRPIPHVERRPREYLPPKEVERLIAAARQNRYEQRDVSAPACGSCLSPLE